MNTYYKPHLLCLWFDVKLASNSLHRSEGRQPINTNPDSQIVPRSTEHSTFCGYHQQFGINRHSSDKLGKLTMMLS